MLPLTPLYNNLGATLVISCIFEANFLVKGNNSGSVSIALFTLDAAFDAFSNLETPLANLIGVAILPIKGKAPKVCKPNYPTWANVGLSYKFFPASYTSG